MELFEKIGENAAFEDRPLADLIRPQNLNEFIGQTHLVGKNQPLQRLMENEQPISMILWGPPGVGKTTLARLFARACKGNFVQLSAVGSGVGEVRKVIEKARENKRLGLRTILFIDEIHRFNKAQQDALLHSVEDGTLFFIGATTENPSFEVINPLLSRCHVYSLGSLSEEELSKLLIRAVPALEEKIGQKISLDGDARQLLLTIANGDARELLNGLELAAFLTRADAKGCKHLNADIIKSAFQRKIPRYDKSGEMHYDTISAFIKSVRGSDPNAALHYLVRMLEAGEEPRFIARRLIILASEDIGNADPLALILATSAFHAVHFIGMPEAQIVLAQATTYLAAAPKSNASYIALQKALKDVRNQPQEPVPMHLRNAPTEFMEKRGYGKGYRYPHDFPGAFIDEDYLPQNFKNQVYYHPTNRGMEQEILQRLCSLWPARYRTPKVSKKTDDSKK